MEFSFGSPAFQNLLYVYDFRIGMEMIDITATDISTGWRIAGAVKILIAIIVAAIIIITLRYRPPSAKSK